MPDADEPTTTAKRGGAWLLWTVIGGGLAALMAVVLVVALTPQPAQTTAQPDVSNQMSNVLEMNPMINMNTVAPAVKLTDQNGKPLTLKEFRGKSVVLTFDDDECTDLCTLLAQDVLAANKDLGANAKNVAYLSINANPFYPGVADVKSWTDSHGLGKTANWYFGTTTPTTMTALEKSYGVDVTADAASKTIMHGAEMFFIDPQGHEREIGQFGTESANTALFGHAMAQLSAELLPSSERGTVGGSAAAETGGSTAVGSKAAPIVLPELGTSATVSTAQFAGKYTVVNFWASTCSACVTEMPAIESEAKAAGSAFAFVGVDVSDDPGRAAAFAAKSGASYPLLNDSTGAVAGRFQITGLPYTVILDPSGTVVTRHPGAMTAEQLDYILQTLKTEAGE
jgi:cytochrome oxidase Cu insertion factor (SCO1/SenC/PrrC family)/thiol-disulfide isomerase/thioredoxin